ncbi:MAG: heme-binding domain-containing protein [Solirubrobacterales bacterium]|nr:heme-binding domain-containing protein [Solirubrobacterales bacterium]
MIRTWAPRVVLIVLGALLVIQLVPYGRDHANPAPTRAAKFPDARTEQLFAGACGDCHSYNTTWPWYSNVAPVSWLVQSDVEDGRGVLNVSTWDRPQPAVDEVAQAVIEGEMPPLQYKPMHPDGRLSDAERRQLVDGLRRLYTSDPPGA